MDQKQYVEQRNLEQNYYNFSDSDLLAIKQSLPDKKYYEYAYHKSFNPNAKWDTWTPWDIWDYSIQDLNRFDKIIINNKNFINNKRVLDLGCHVGYISLFSLYFGAKYVTGTNVRENYIAIADEVCSEAGYDNFTFVNSNIHNLTELLDLCNDCDTVILSGLIYLLTNHVNILKTISKSNATTIIIDNLEYSEIKNIKIPLIYYKDQTTSVSTNCIGDALIEIVGTPNQSWIDYTMSFLKWNKISEDRYDMFVQKKQRTVSVFSKPVRHSMPIWDTSI